MGAKGVVCLIAFAVVLFASEVVCSDSKKNSAGNLIDFEEINEDMVELIRANCRLELSHSNEAVEDLKLDVTEDKIPLDSRLSGQERILKSLSILDPHVEETLLDCIRKKSIVFAVSGEESHTKNWYTKYLESIFPSRDAFRRRKLVEASAPSPSRSLSVSPPVPGPSPSSGRVPSHSRVPSTQGVPGTPFFPRDFNDPSTVSNTDPSPDSASVTSDKKTNSNRTVVIAVVVTATVTFFIVALLFLCYNRVCGGGGVGQNDEKPLLSLSLSDYSSGASHRPYASENSIDKGKLSHQSFYDNSSLDGSLYMESDASKIGTPLGAPLELPPGRLSTSGLPPLKPPPGRMDPPLPPPPGRVDPPLPPPSSANSVPLPPPPVGGPPPPPEPPPPSSLRPLGGPPRPPPAGPPPPPPPVHFGMKTGGPRPPPPPSGGVPPPRPPAIGLKPPRPNAPPAPNRPLDESDSSKAKLKPFFWDKVLANPDQSMVWHQIKSGSFQFNEEMIETLFGYSATENNKKQHKSSSSQDPPTQYIQIIDPKKAQNLSILLKALNVTTEEVCDALQEGNELPAELLHTLIKMAPTAEEELKLRLYNGELARLGNAERFLKFLVDIPFAFKRLEALLFMVTLEEEESIIKESFTTLESACVELRKSRLFLKLLEAVLKTGNRMNDGTFRGSAQAFKLDTLLKLSDVKGIDGKTTLLHFVVQEIIRSEGIRAARAARDNRSFSSIKTDDLLEDISNDSEEHYRNLGLQVVSGLGNELENVKKAAILDADNLTGTVAKLGHALVKSRDFLNSDMKNIEEDNGFHETLKNFVQNAEEDIMWLLAEEKRIMSLVKSTADYFHGKAGRDEGLRLFVIVRDFLIILDKACKEVKNAPRKPPNKPPPKKEDQSTAGATSGPRQSPSPDPRQRLFPAIAERRMDHSSSDEESP